MALNIESLQDCAGLFIYLFIVIVAKNAWFCSFFIIYFWCFLLLIFPIVVDSLFKLLALCVMTGTGRGI